MMIKRIPVVLATCVLLGSGLVASAASPVPLISGVTAEAVTRMRETLAVGSPLSSRR